MALPLRHSLGAHLLAALGLFVPLYTVSTWVLRALTAERAAPLRLWWHWGSRGLVWALCTVGLGVALASVLAWPRLRRWEGAVHPRRSAQVGAVAAMLAAAGWTWLFPYLILWVDPAATQGPALLRAIAQARWWVNGANLLAGGVAVLLVYLPWLLAAPARPQRAEAPADV